MITIAACYALVVTVDIEHLCVSIVATTKYL